MGDYRDLTLYVVRHGETEDNVAGRWTGCNDLPLTARGREHARASGQVLKRIAGDLAALDFFSSPLHRASVTMRLLREAAGLPETGYRADRRLKENDCGDWSSLTVDEILSRDAEHFARRALDEWHWKAPGGESWAEQSKTVGRFMRSLSRDSVIVCHGMTSALVRAQALDLSPAEAMRGGLPNSGVARYIGGSEVFFPE